MSYPGGYPALDQPVIFHPNPPVYGIYTTAPYHQTPGSQAPVAKSELSEPLIPSDQPKKQLDPMLYTKISFILVLICTIIEFSGVAYTLIYSYLYEYCYWEFGLFYYKKSADQDLIAADSKGKVKGLYKELNCKEKNYFPECPDLCHLAKGLKKSQVWMVWGSGISGAITLAVILLYLISILRNKQLLSCLSSGLLLLSSYLAFAGALILYLVHSNLLSDFEDPSEKDLKNFDDPNELDLEDGGKILPYLLVFMLIYRVILIILSKSRS